MENDFHWETKPSRQSSEVCLWGDEGGMISAQFLSLNASVNLLTLVSLLPFSISPGSFKVRLEKKASWQIMRCVLKVQMKCLKLNQVAVIPRFHGPARDT